MNIRVVGSLWHVLWLTIHCKFAIAYQKSFVQSWPLLTSPIAHYQFIYAILQTFAFLLRDLPVPSHRYHTSVDG